MLYRREAVFWIKYYVNGRAIRESTRTDKETKAKRFLKEREGRAATGQPVIPRIDRVRYDDLAEDLRRHYETSGERDLKEADTRLKPLKAFLPGGAWSVLTRPTPSVMSRRAKRLVSRTARSTASCRCSEKCCGSPTRAVKCFVCR